MPRKPKTRRVGKPPAATSSDTAISQHQADALTAQASQAGNAATTDPPTSGAGQPGPDPNLIDQAELDQLSQQLQPAGDDNEATPAPTTEPRATKASAPPADADAPDGSLSTTDAPGQTADEPAAPTVIGSKIAVAPEDALPLNVPQLPQAEDSATRANIDLLDDVELDVKIELGRTQMYVEDVLQLGKGSVVELDKLAGDPVDVYVNDRLVARGEVLVLNDNFCVRINDIVTAAVEAEEGK